VDGKDSKRITILDELFFKKDQENYVFETSEQRKSSCQKNLVNKFNFIHFSNF